MEKVLISLDQGNSKTDIVIVSCSGCIVARECYVYECIDFDFERWAIIKEIVVRLLSSINATLCDVEYLLAAVCGADREEDNVRIQQILSEILGISNNRITIVNDSQAALRAGMPFQAGPGNYAVVYAGTMFNCTLLSHSGKKYTYGHLVNGCDNGSFAMGRLAWETVIDSYNGFCDSTIMESIFLNHYGSKSISSLSTDFYSNKKTFSPCSFSKLLFTAVEHNDIVATEIMSKFAHRWAMYVVNGLSKICISVDENIDVVLAGGIFKNCSDLWLDLIKSEIREYCPNAFCSLSSVEPVVGAVLLLLEKINRGTLSAEIINNVKKSKLYKQLQIKIKAESEKL